MSQKLQSQRAFFEIEPPGSPADWLRVGGVRAINNLRSGSATEIDVSDLQSTEKEYVIGLSDPGSMDLDMLFDPSDPGQKLMGALKVSGARVNLRVGAPNDLAPGSPGGFSLWNFQGFVQTFPFSLGVDAAQTATATVRVTGAITESNT